MSNPPLPPEIFDYIVDILHDEPKTLQNLCLVAKSRVPRTRKHLFADIKFSSPKDLESWKKTFPDPSNSPAYHTLALSVNCPAAVMAEDMEEGGWIRAFSHVLRLEVESGSTPTVTDSRVSLVPFHGFSPVLKSLHVSFALSRPQSSVFELIISFPLLENLTLIDRNPLLDDRDDFYALQIDTPSTSPAFTGTLKLVLSGGMGFAARRLLDLPNGLHFRELKFLWFEEEDIRWAAKLAVRCSHTLECLDLEYDLLEDSSPAFIDLSRAIKLTGIVFRLRSLRVEWITMALRTITTEHRDLWRITICLCYDTTLGFLGPNVRRRIGEQIYRQWSGLDHILVQIWELRSIRPKVICLTLKEELEVREMRDSIRCLLPEAAEKRLIELFWA